MSSGNHYWHFLDWWRCEPGQAGPQWVQLALYLSLGRCGRRHCGAQTVITEMSAGLKDTSRGPEGGAEERERGEKGPTFVGVLFPPNCPSMQCQPVLSLQMSFISLNSIILREISYFRTTLLPWEYINCYEQSYTKTRISEWKLTLKVVFG